MKLTKCLRPAVIALSMVVALYANHLSVSFERRQLCDLAMFEGDIPEYCYGDTLPLALQPWSSILVDQLGRKKESDQDLVQARDAAVFVVDGIILLLGILAMKKPRSCAGVRS